MAEARSIALLPSRFKSGVALAVDAEGLHLRATVTVPPPGALLAAAARGARRVARAVAWSAWPLTTPTGLGVAVVLAAAALQRAPRAREALLPLLRALLRALQPPANGGAADGDGSSAAAVAREAPFSPAAEGALLAAAAAAAVAAAVLAVAWLSRLALFALLHDRSFLRLRAGATVPPLQRLWFACVRALTRGRPLLLQFEGSLPRLPLPTLDATVARYVASQAPLASEEAQERLEALAAAFLRNEGPALQRRLWLKALVSRNYVSDWWQDFVYLRGREPIACLSNYYALDCGRSRPTQLQASRAAVLTAELVRYMLALEDEAVAPVLLGGGAGAGGVPLCMAQARRLFSTSRIPGLESDRVRHWDPLCVRHVSVYCGGSLYLLDVFGSDGAPRAPEELEDAFADIAVDAAAREAAAARLPRGSRAKPGLLREAEACLPALTAARRADWAEAREMHFGDGVNKRSLNAVEKALFCVVLDASSPAVLDWSTRARAGIVGLNPSSRPGLFFDKSFNLIVHANGQAAINAEHSWADALVIGHLMEHMLVGEIKGEHYDADGRVKLRDGAARCGSRLLGAAGLSPAPKPAAASTRRPRSLSVDAVGLSEPALSPTSAPSADASAAGRWQRLRWAISVELEDAIFAARASLSALAADLDLVVSPYQAYGKRFIKGVGVSPDAYLQMALQLAYMRDQGHADNTYEAASTRLFAAGRTETVRSASAEALAFVAAVDRPGASPSEKLAALRAACARHVDLYTRAMTGQGCDRHLFALYVVAVGTGTESPFLKSALGQPWRLSTSQVPQQQTSLWDIKDARFASAMSAGGGFAAVASNGYGVSYSVVGEDAFSFHVSSCVSSAPATSATRFTARILQALEDMRAVLTEALGDEAGKAAAAGRPAAASDAEPLATPQPVMLTGGAS
jgi:carnitine O-palmitoyltransferase 1